MKNAWRSFAIIVFLMLYLVANVLEVSHVLLDVPASGFTDFPLPLFLAQSVSHQRNSLFPVYRCLNHSSGPDPLFVLQGQQWYPCPSRNADRQNFVWMFTLYVLHRRLPLQPHYFDWEDICSAHASLPKVAGNHSFSLTLRRIVVSTSSFTNTDVIYS